jgi:hypothetical protein
MTLELWIDLGALSVAGVSLLMTYVRTARMHGGDRQRIKFAEDAIAKLAAAESVTALAARIDDLEGDVKLVAAALTKVAVIEAKLDGLDRLMTRETDEIKHTLRGLETRSLDPPPARTRRSAG